MSKPFTLEQFWKKTDALLADVILQDDTSMEVAAADAVRLVIARPTSAPDENLMFVRESCRLARRILEAMAKKTKDGKTIPCGVSLLQLKAAGNYLSVADALTFPVRKGAGAGARARWLNALVNVENIPVVARAFLWPERFTLADQGEAADVLMDTCDAFSAALVDFRETGHKSALVGFLEEDFRQCLLFLKALQNALPIPRETMAANGREYTTAPAEFFKSSTAN